MADMEHTTAKEILFIKHLGKWSTRPTRRVVLLRKYIKAVRGRNWADVDGKVALYYAKRSLEREING